jgi:hemoglobin/transferrin/lactoferrin receptor protein
MSGIRARPGRTPTPAGRQHHGPLAEGRSRTLAEIGYSHKGSGESPLNLDVRAYRQEMERRIYAWSSVRQRDISRPTSPSRPTASMPRPTGWCIRSTCSPSAPTYWQMGASPERYLNSPPNFATVRRDPFDDGRIGAFGVYVQDDMRFGKLNLLAALPPRHGQGRGRRDGQSGQPGADVTNNLDRDDSAFSGSLGAIYEIARCCAHTPTSRAASAPARCANATNLRRAATATITPAIRRSSRRSRPSSRSASRDRTIKFLATSWRSGATASRLHVRPGHLRHCPRHDVCGAANAGACKETVNISKVTLTASRRRARWQAWRGHWLKAGLSLVRGENDALTSRCSRCRPTNSRSAGKAMSQQAGRPTSPAASYAEQNRVATTFSRGSENKTAGFATADLGATYTLNKQHSFRVAIKNLFDREVPRST